MNPWTPDRVSALAPDSSSLSAGQGLASASKWTSFAISNDGARALWGLCQGSGKQPYQTRIDLSEPAFKCSCPSRKFPCKHGLGLLLLYAKSPQAFKPAPEPAWVSDWLTERSARVEKKVEKAKAAADKPVDEEAQAKRAAKRDERVQAGVIECRQWLDDLLRRGLAGARTDADFERLAARMVDAQAPGLAGSLRKLNGVLHSGEGWESRALDHLGRLHLLLEAAEKLSTLPADLATDVRVALGYPQSKDETLARAGVEDTWAVVGVVHEDEDRLTVRRTWLWGRTTARRALLVDFAVNTGFGGGSGGGAGRLEPGFVPGLEFQGEIVYYPSRVPLRALVKGREEPRPLTTPLAPPEVTTIRANLRAYAEALAANPWLQRSLILLDSARLAREHSSSSGSPDRWWVVDPKGDSLPLRPGFCVGPQLWKLLSVSGGLPVTLTLEWDGEYALPIAALPASAAGVSAANAICDLAPRWVA